MFKDIKNANVHVNRIKKILDMSDKPTLNFGDAISDFDYGGIDFINVSLNTEGLPEIKHIDMHIRENQVTLIQGKRHCGKRTIFKCLTREIAPTDGRIVVDGIGINDYSYSSYIKQLNVVTTNPFFIKGTILDNLTLIEKDTAKIRQVCEDLGIHQQIESLAKKYDSDVETLPLHTRYLLDFARVLLAKCEIIIFYEIPTALGELEKDNIKKVIAKYAHHKTIIFFSQSYEWAELAQKIIEIEDGQVKSISYNK